MSQHVCVKKANLNKIGYENLREWLANKNNLYVGRYGRISVKENDGSISIFHYPGSKWGNPFKVSEEMPVEKSLKLYEEHLHKSGLIKQLLELQGKNLGCFCENNAQCHAKLLVKLLKEKEGKEN